MTMDLDKKIRFSPGILFCFLIVAIPTFGWMFAYDFSILAPWQVVSITVAKIGAFGGSAMFAMSLFFSAKYIWFEKLFGGLDKMYAAHHLFGVLGLILLIVHPIALSVLRIQNGLSSTIKLWFSFDDATIFFGNVALYLLMIVLFYTVYAKIKYEKFIQIHRYLGFIFLIGMLHAFLSGSILGTSQFIYYYLIILTIAATLSFVAYSVLHDILHQALSYRVISVKKLTSGVTEITLKPVSRVLRFTPGQFVYIEFTSLKEQGYHPFSIVSGKQHSNLTLAIRKAGDFTHDLKKIKIGSKANIKGPYGGFSPLQHKNKKQLWIAGGIGVTPFISCALSMPYHRNPYDIEMIYATADNKPYGINMLENIEKEKHGFNVTLAHERNFGHINLAMLSHNIKDIKQREIFICGPPPMMNAIEKEAEEMGIHKKLNFEEFSY